MKIQDLIMFTKKDIAAEIGEIKPGLIKPYFSNGKWSSHELLVYLLSITGPAELFISTFSIGEAAINTLFHLFQEKQIQSLEMLIDYTAKKHRIELLNFAENVGAKIHIDSNHSKIMLIKNDSWTISVIGSGNMTPNPRYEAGVIFTTPGTHSDYQNKLTEIFNQAPSWKYAQNNLKK